MYFDGKSLHFKQKIKARKNRIAPPCTGIQSFEKNESFYLTQKIRKPKKNESFYLTQKIRKPEKKRVVLSCAENPKILKKTSRFILRKKSENLKL